MREQADIIHQYRLLRREDGELWRLGRSRTGVTYKAEDLAHRNQVALKVFHLRFTDYTSIRALACFNHPAVARLLYFGRHGSEDFCVTEFVEGESLDSFVRRVGPLHPARALRIISLAANALEAAHAQKFAHKDLKPAHLLIPRASPEAITLVGFQVSDGRISAEVPAGALDFASPEQVEGNQVDARTDIYSLGLTLLFLVSGQTPGPGGSPLRTLTLAKQHTNEYSGVPEPIRELLKLMLADDPAERIATAAALETAIAACDRVLLAAPVVERMATVTELPATSSPKTAFVQPHELPELDSQGEAAGKVEPDQKPMAGVEPIREESPPAPAEMPQIHPGTIEAPADLQRPPAAIENSRLKPVFPPRLPPKLLPRVRILPPAALAASQPEVVSPVIIAPLDPAPDAWAPSAEEVAREQRVTAPAQRQTRWRWMAAAALLVLSAFVIFTGSPRRAQREKGTALAGVSQRALPFASPELLPR